MKTNYMLVKLCSKMSTTLRKIKIQFFIKLLGTTYFLLIVQIVNSQSFNANLAAKLQDTLDYLVTANPSTKGITASVFCPGQGIWEGSSGISHIGVPITSDMVLPLASNSKLFTAVTMLILQESGVLDLDDPISNWLPTFANVDPNITIRQLLNHTSGVADMNSTQAQIDSIDANPNRVWTPEEVLAWIGPPSFAPGTGYLYSNTNYILAGMVAESATGFPIHQLIRDSILTPLDLDSTFFAGQEPVVGTIAHPWKNGVDINNIPRTSLHTAIGTAGAMYSTAGEMSQWYRALMNGDVINDNSFAEMTNFLLPGNYGLGIAKYSFNLTTEWGHGGNTTGGRTRTLYDPCMKVFVCGLGNSNPSGVDGVTVILHKVLIDNLPGCPGAITGITSVCQGENSVTYTIPPITNAAQYVWTLPAGVTGISNTNSITVDYTLAAVSGNIEVKATNMYGESATVSLPVTVNNIPATPVIILSNDTLHSDAAIGNQWYDGNGMIAGATNQDFVVTVNEGYYVIATVNGCSSAPSTIMNTNLGINDESGKSTISIFPNPSNGIFKLNTENVQEGNLEIYNTFGQLIYSTTQFTHEIDLSDQPKGTYFIKLLSGDKIHSQKIIIQ